MEIDGHTRLAAVVANPIKHTVSPFIQNQTFEDHHLNAVYLAWEIEEKDLKETIQNIRRYDMLGMNISMPYKSSVLPYLDDMTDTARWLEAVNVVSYEDGKIVGHNTDGRGFFLNLLENYDYDVKGKTITVLGGGGAAKSIFAQAAINGASVINIFDRTKYIERTQSKVKELAEQFNLTIDVYPIEDKGLIEEMASRSSLLVNATPVGMDGESMIINPNMTFPEEIIVADVIYSPLETPFLKLAREKGLVTVNGLGMLLYQAAIAFNIWTGKVMDTKKMMRLLEDKFK